ncbi:MAG: nicotinate (nicotinamide) nucleotide adenylyltransferase [Candidatus Sericytochromatia bacterium]|nr:nicotinate (nicotinamide) nucleotide adenylyltransferase [Candidatus Sericytochromatia bacterium]
MTRARYALYGGTFDPFHLGHLAVARAARDSGLVDEVLVVPAGSPPHRGATLAGAEERWCMAVLATVMEPGLRVVRWETERAREGPTFAIDTLRLARAALGWDVDLWWVIGADALRALGSWHRLVELVQEVRFLVVPRDGEDGAWLASWLERELPEVPRDRFVFLPMPRVAVSSTGVRACLARGGPTQGLLPPLVGAHVARYGLYVDRGGGASQGAAR